MMAQQIQVPAASTPALVPEWLRSLVRAVRREAIQAKDPRVKSLWIMLRQRQLHERSAWLRNVLRRIWRKGAAARSRPRITRRLVRLLRRWGMIPPATTSAARAPIPIRTLKPVTVRALRPVTVRAIAAAAGPLPTARTARQ